MTGAKSAYWFCPSIRASVRPTFESERMTTVATKDDPGKWWLSLLYIAVVLAAGVWAVLSHPIVDIVSFVTTSPSEAVPGMLKAATLVGGTLVVVWVCLRVPAVRRRLRPGAASIAASSATFLAVGWGWFVLFAFAEDGDVWSRIPLGVAACAPVLLIAIGALTISRPIQRDHDRRIASAATALAVRRPGPERLEG